MPGSGTSETRRDPSRVRLSVVIPAFNESGYLQDALASLRAQDFAGSWEIVVVDNGSTDDTARIAADYGARVLTEQRRGVCWARQLGTTSALGDIVVSTDADTVHPRDWLTRLDAQFLADPTAIAVAGPCRYDRPLWWAALFPRLWFAGIAVVYTLTGRIFYVTATNIAFRVAGFPGYDTSLTQGGDEFDLLRRLRRHGRVVWDRHNPVTTSSRRMDQGLAYTLIVSFAYQYGLSYLLNRASSGRIRGIAPAIRHDDANAVRRRRRHWRAGVAVTASLIAALRWVSRTPRTSDAPSRKAG